jgi:hypothetical protein
MSAKTLGYLSGGPPSAQAFSFGKGHKFLSGLLLIFCRLILCIVTIMELAL